MANPEHVAILKQGVKAWNKWRDDNPEIIPDLSGLKCTKEEFDGTPIYGSWPLNRYNSNGPCVIGLAGINLQNSNLEKIVIKNANLRESNLKGAKLKSASLTYSALWNVDLSKASLAGADLSFNDAEGACLKRAFLKRSNLEHSWFSTSNFERAFLSDANLEWTRFDGANLKNAYLSGANLHYASLHIANLNNANLSKANLIKTHFRGADLTDANLLDVTYYMRTSSHYKGIKLSGCYGSERFKRYASHQAFIEELQESGRRNKCLVALWSVLADCGRSPWRWMGWSAVSVLFHANLYWWFFGSDAFHLNDDLSFDPWVALYYSVVTFTTLGFGDITPITFWAMFWVTIEVIFGYVMLGGLISFMFSKLLPRG
jgi:uncharacterized protein YjbI with pentapeptide repeats